MSEKRKKRILRLCLVFLVLLSASIAFLLPRPMNEPQDNTVAVNDGHGTIRIEPIPGLPASTLRRSEFTHRDNAITYTGMEYTACQGVDVSDWQNEIRWQEVADSGIDFAVIRCGYRSYGIGELRPDNCFEVNYDGSGEAGLRRGVYFFSQAVSVEEAREEAAYVLLLLQGRALELPIFYDWETVTDPEGRANAVDGSIVTACAAAFCKAIEEAGYRAGVYFNKHMGYHTYDLAQCKDYTLWLAEPGKHPTFYYHAALWQYDHHGTVPGIDTEADRNILFEAKKIET